MLVAAWVFGISESSVSCLMSLWFSTQPHTVLEGHPCQASMPAEQLFPCDAFCVVKYYGRVEASHRTIHTGAKPSPALCQYAFSMKGHYVVMLETTWEPDSISVYVIKFFYQCMQL